MHVQNSGGCNVGSKQIAPMGTMKCILCYIFLKYKYNSVQHVWALFLPILISTDFYKIADVEDKVLSFLLRRHVGLVKWPGELVVYAQTQHSFH